MSFQAIFTRCRYLLVAPDPHSIAPLFFDERRVVIDPSSPEHLSEECCPLFPEKKILLIDVDSTKEKALTSLLSRLPPSSNLIKILFLASSFSFPLSLRKEVEKEGEIIDCLTDKGVSSLLFRLSSNEGISMTERESRYLVMRYGKDRALLFSEMKKLFLFVAMKKSLTIDDIDAICLKKEENTLWQIGDAILQKNFERALTVSRQLLQEGSSLIGLIAHLRSQIKTLYTQSLLLESGGQEALQARYPTIPSSLLAKKGEALRHYGKERIKEALIFVTEAELAAKNSPLDDSFVLEKLFLKL